MANDADTEYFASRERREREMAAATTDPAAKRIHLEMAENYARRRRDLQYGHVQAS